MENQHHLSGGSVNVMPNHGEEDSRQHPQRVSRFSIQRLDTRDMMVANNVPRRRASVNHGQQQSNNGSSRSEFVASSYITMDDINLSQPVRPSANGRSASVREHAKGVGLLPAVLDQNRYGNALKAHLRDSVRTNRPLRHHLSRETLPSLDNYQAHSVANRATLEELRLGADHQQGIQKGGNSGQVPAVGGLKFGWIQGVFIRCLLNIWGVMLFLRLSWVVAEAGIGQAILIVLLATAVTSLTALSMSAISTNGQIKGGGTYYMISRSLGPEFGAAIGIIFALANAVAVSLHTVGFCEALNDMLEELGVQIVDGDLNDIRIVGSVTLVVLAMIVGIGMEWEAKAQLLFMGILMVALANFILGSFLGPSDIDKFSKGFVGYDFELLTSNFYSDYRVFDGFQQNFFSVFSIFFPAATGILAGANISGDLKDPSVAIPKGTLLAIAVTSVSYIIFAIIAGATVLRDATGIPSNYNNTVATINDYIEICAEQDCEWGLHNSFQVMTLVSAFGPLNYAGCFAATLSSALACFVSAPKVFQALCQDRLFPHLQYFAKGYGKTQEPLRAYILTFLIALACVLIAQLNIIAPLITNCYLASYALVNFSTFHIDLIQPVGWRPTFRYYNKWLSLLGCGLSVSAMFLCSWPTALVTSTVVMTLFLIVKYRKPDVNWGSSGQAQVYKTALITVQQLSNIEEHVKTYTPQILVMTGLPNMRPSLVDFAYLLCKNNSLMVCGDIVKERQSHKQRSQRINKSSHWLRAHKTKSFYSLMDNISFPNGVGALLQATGVGKMKPNILLLGYQSEWRTHRNNEIDDYCAAINTALEMHVAVAVLRVQEGLDYTGIIGDFDSMEDFSTGKLKSEGIDNPQYTNTMEGSIASSNATPFTISGSVNSSLSEFTLDETRGGKIRRNKIQLSSMESSVTNITSVSSSSAEQRHMKKSRVLFRDPQGNELPAEVQNSICRFRVKQKRGTIDVWWLYDDGGLSMLLPHILTTRSNWANSKLRVFCLADTNEEQRSKQESMRLLLGKFRIPVSDVVVIPDMTYPPSAPTKSWFDALTRDFVRKDDDPSILDSSVPVIKESELMAQKPKTFNFMRLRELLLENSTNANLVVMTLPISRKGTVSGPLYMSWLETLTANMPPFLLVRGNQASVLTFYS
ncbi:bumetanide-sensitive sodium-(potassium)-chloride cotransporter-like [Daphnia pulicaria]|uniref:bumetanide-sensitive sodium-(potassium)-chloride cotransporter-like n=1 Tax=Daphnia pulicaria TaxID=35523 RepID=UPI001EEB5B83|nr:bumetanide-sensitive sodium-(potassium)-chloride cotransporter-like [Daphnia pulicaria]